MERLKLKKGQLAALAVMAVVVLCRILYIFVYGEVDKEYKTSYTVVTSEAAEIPCTDLSQTFKSDGRRLNSLEVMFTGIAENKAGHVTVSVTLMDDLIYQTNISLANVNNWEWKKIFVNAKMRTGYRYTVSFDASDDCVQIPNLLLTGGENVSPEAEASYNGGEALDGQLAVMYGYLRSPDILEKAVASSVWLLFLCLAYLIMASWEKIAGWGSAVYAAACSYVRKEILLVIAEVMGCMVLVNCSGFEYQAPTKILFYLISLVSACKIEEKMKYVEENIIQGKKKYGLIFLYLFAAFSLVGQRILVYPLTVKLTAAGIWVFTATVLWFIPVINTTVYGMDRLAKTAVSDNRGVSRRKFVVIVAVLLLLPAAYNLYANNPGISSPDTYTTMIGNAHNLQGMVDWHPAFYCMVLNMILSVWDSTYAVIFVQYFFWCFVMVELLLYLRKKGMKDSVLLASAFFSGVNAGNFLHLNTIWKDIPYTLSLLWTLVIFAKLSLNFEEYRGKRFIYAELVAALIGIFFYRKNGIVSFVAVAAMMLITLYRNKKVWISFVTAVVLIAAIKGPVYSHFKVERTGKHGMYIGLSQDILGVYYAGGEISEDTLKMVNVMTTYNNAEYHYIPTYAEQSYDLDMEPTKFIAGYIDTFLHNPILMIRAVIAREDAAWNIFTGQDARLECVNYYVTMDGANEWNNYYPARQYNSLYPSMASMTGYTANTQWIAAIEWRSGLFTLLGILAFVYMVYKRGIKKYILVMAPIIGHLLSLLLSTGWSDFRYFWPLNLMNLAIILIAVVVGNEAEKESEEEEEV